MTKSLKKSAAGNGEPELDARERFRSLLVPIDLTPASDRVIGRLARLPLAESGLVTLVHVVPGSLAPREQRDAERDAKQSLSEEARHLAASLPNSVRVQAVVKVGGAAREITELARTQAADLIVMGRGGGRALRDTFLGSTAGIRSGPRLRPRGPRETREA